jgi:hypothetical protein
VTMAPPNKALKLTAPRGMVVGRVGRCAACSPFGEHRRRSLTRCSTHHGATSLGPDGRRAVTGVRIAGDGRDKTGFDVP